LRAGLERDGLVILLLHRLFETDRDIEASGVHPLEGATIAHLRQVIEGFLRTGFRFVSAADVLSGAVSGSGRYAMITFDDGYANNALVPGVLAEYSVPALFFISTQHVLEQRCFWWDALYRERRRRHASPVTILAEGASLKSLRTDAVEARLRLQFGDDVLRPRHELERPFTTAELVAFARVPGVTIGNHTADHAILTNYDAAGVRDQIGRAQRTLGELLGQAPAVISYPNGNYTLEVCQVARELGLQAGITVDPHKNYLPIRPDDGNLMRLGRFLMQGTVDLTAQLTRWRSDIGIITRLRRARLGTAY
jgi:peptidoglycan/xylan/chitin deacetylase (PgdA/CDA1 family)